MTEWKTKEDKTSSPKTRAASLGSTSNNGKHRELERSRPTNSEDAHRMHVYRMYRNPESTTNRGGNWTNFPLFFAISHGQGACMNFVCMSCTDEIKRGERLAGEVAGWFDEAEGWRDRWQGGLTRRPAGDVAGWHSACKFEEEGHHWPESAALTPPAPQAVDDRNSVIRPNRESMICMSICMSMCMYELLLKNSSSSARPYCNDRRRRCGPKGDFHGHSKPASSGTSQRELLGNSSIQERPIAVLATTVQAHGVDSCLSHFGGFGNRSYFIKKDRFSAAQKGSRKPSFLIITESIYVIDALPGKELFGNHEPYRPESRWALKGVKIGEAKNPGPTIDCSVINATHAWTNQELLIKIKGHFTFGQEHSTARIDHKKVRDAICGHYSKEGGKAPREIHLSNVDPENADRNVGRLFQINNTDNRIICPNPYNETLIEINGQGRVQLYGITICSQTTRLVYNVYLHAGADSNKDAMERTNEFLESSRMTSKNNQKDPFSSWEISIAPFPIS